MFTPSASILAGGGVLLGRQRPGSADATVHPGQGRLSRPLAAPGGHPFAPRSTPLQRVTRYALIHRHRSPLPDTPPLRAGHALRGYRPAHSRRTSSSAPGTPGHAQRPRPGLPASLAAALIAGCVAGNYGLPRSPARSPWHAGRSSSSSSGEAGRPGMPVIRAIRGDRYTGRFPLPDRAARMVTLPQPWIWNGLPTRSPDPAATCRPFRQSSRRTCSAWFVQS